MSEANIRLFADDTLLFVACENLPSLFTKMETALTEFVSWADSNYLTLNYSKTNYVLFSRISSIQTDLKLKVANNIINRVKTSRYLGFVVDENLSWKEHAKLVGNKLSRSLGVIRRLKFRFPNKILKMIYHSIFHPHLSYGCSIWASNFISCYKRVQIIQNKVVQIISPVQHTDDISLHFKFTKIFDVSKTRDFQIANFCFKYFNNLLPSSFQNLFTLNQDLHTYDTRHSCDIVQEAPSTKRASFLIRFFAPFI